MRERRLSVVDLDYFKTHQTLLDTLKIQCQHQVESYVSVEAELCSPSFGCARSKRQYPTVLHNLKSVRWMLGCEWMDCLLLIYGMW